MLDQVRIRNFINTQIKALGTVGLYSCDKRVTEKYNKVMMRRDNNICVAASNKMANGGIWDIFFWKMPWTAKKRDKIDSKAIDRAVNDVLMNKTKVRTASLEPLC
ncbi:hypothetical protein FQA39_LY12730 [Lamprigera yunnana]|nr:hypothetical protein FQA39_LY12730 [Lamprigera yunnana]